MREERGANLRHDDRARRPLEQADAQALFKFGNSPAHARFRDIECTGGARKAAVRDYRAALNDAPKSAKVPPSSVKKMDAWLAAKPK